VVLDGVEDDASGVRGEVSIAQHPRGHRHGAPGVIGTLPHRVGAVQPDVMQEGREAQDLPIVVQTFRTGQLLGEVEDPQAVSVAPDRVRPRPGDQRLYLLDDNLHRPASVPADRIPPLCNAGHNETPPDDIARLRRVEADPWISVTCLETILVSQVADSLGLYFGCGVSCIGVGDDVAQYPIVAHDLDGAVTLRTMWSAAAPMATYLIVSLTARLTARGLPLPARSVRTNLVVHTHDLVRRPPGPKVHLGGCFANRKRKRGVPRLLA
jgi:hypothetical protein